MTKINAKKGGFTLTEIIIVVAIVLILSSAAFAGVAVTLNRAQTMKKNLSDNNGNNFESAAWYSVNHLTFGDEGFIPTATYSPEDVEEEETTPLETLSEEEIEALDNTSNDEIQNLLNAGVSRDHIWVSRDENGNITDWNWYAAEDPELSSDLDADVKASIDSHRLDELPKGGGSSGSGSGTTNGGGGGTVVEAYDPYKDYDDVTTPTQKSLGSVTTTVCGSNANGGGSKPVVNTIGGDDTTQYITMTDLNGWNPTGVKVTIYEENGKTKMIIDSGNYIFVQGKNGNDGMEGAGWGKDPITLEASQKKWLKDNYGIVVN